ncbi:hypothetical protein NP233_g925 [Leucocoprinus birnbaumii]|uniref:Uncharacterized protein n=1 Tax=Leucocoprinus birnbaumii TaxID=56174 RepID=A0AAD5W0Y9_9AGAR|nr:hypothetical protein NP233_g925 [Leucocoprinus birnbaumii]
MRSSHHTRHTSPSVPASGGKPAQKLRKSPERTPLSPSTQSNRNPTPNPPPIPPPASGTPTTRPSNPPSSNPPQPPPISTTISPARSKLKTKVRDFAFASTDDRYIGLGSTAPKANQFPRLNKRLGGSKRARPTVISPSGLIGGIPVPDDGTESSDYPEDDDEDDERPRIQFGPRFGAFFDSDDDDDDDDDFLRPAPPLRPGAPGMPSGLGSTFSSASSGTGGGLGGIGGGARGGAGGRASGFLFRK